MKDSVIEPVLCIPPPSVETAEGSEEETRPARRRRTRSCRVRCVNRNGRNREGTARLRRAQTHAHVRRSTHGRRARSARVRREFELIKDFSRAAHVAPRSSEPPKFAACHSRIDQESDDGDGGPVPETTCGFYPNNPNNPSKMAIIRPKTVESRG